MTLHSSTLATLQQVRAATSAPFLTLGQTVFWDEPLKAAFFRALRQVDPAARMTGGVHDTDYFAKLPGGVTVPSGVTIPDDGAKFVLLGHNDGETRALWSAAGEMAALFGSETVVTRSDLGENGVEVLRVARDYPGGLEALLSHETEAWGWNGLVHAGQGSLIAANVKLGEVAPILREQLTGAFTTSLRALNDAPPSATVAATVQGWVTEFCEAHPTGTLSDLYEALIPRLWELVGGTAEGLDTSRSTELFRFNTQTCHQPRWKFLDLFLNPATRATAIRCYNDAVRGSGIYTLDKFGAGALPFDAVLPGRGRGTLRIHRGSVFVETEPPHEVCANCDPSSVQELAALLEREFGPDVVVVGKAVSLISMLAAEYVFVFHERASGYTARTQVMNAAMRAKGLDLQLNPMVRVALAAWDAVGAAPATFALPDHLATAFGSRTLRAEEFGARWRAVCEEQDALRGELRGARSPRALMELLVQWKGQAWQTRLEQLVAARDVLHGLRERTRDLEERTAQLRAEARALREEAARTEIEKGEDFRTRVRPLRDRISDLKEAAAHQLVAVGPDGKPLKLSKEERAAKAAQDAADEAEILDLRAQIAQCNRERANFDHRITANRERARDLSQQANEWVRERDALEHGEQSLQARATLATLTGEAELARLRLVRDSLWVSRGLHYTNVRPTAWWLPLVSPGGEWFDALVSGAQCRLEEL